MREASESRFGRDDHLVWCRFLLYNILAIGISEERSARNGEQEYIARLQQQLRPLWEGLGAQGIEGAALSCTLTLESIGSRIISSQVSPESAELVVEPFPGLPLLEGLADRFDIELERESLHEVFGIDQELANRAHDILKAIADAADVEYLREPSEDGNVRILLRAW